MKNGLTFKKVLILGLVLLFVKSQAVEIPKSLFTIGDSNGMNGDSWPQQIKWGLSPLCQQKFQVTLKFSNYSESGQSISFNKGGIAGYRNTYLTINGILNNSKTALGEVAQRIVMVLGTNDGKYEYRDSIQFVPARLDSVVRKIVAFQDTPSRFTLVTPPPIADIIADTAVQAKFKDGDKRIQKFLPAFIQTALKYRCQYVDIHTPTMDSIVKWAPADGVHYSSPGAKFIGSLILKVILDSISPQPPSQVKIVGDSLKWIASPSLDVIGYEIFQNNTFIGAVAGTSFKLPASTNGLTVCARDGAVNESAKIAPGNTNAVHEIAPILKHQVTNKIQVQLTGKTVLCKSDKKALDQSGLQGSFIVKGK